MELTFFELCKDVLVTSAKGMRVTFKNFFRKPITVQYPFEKAPVAVNWRGRFRQRFDVNTIPLCTVCKACERICPDHCISILGEKNPDPPDKHRKLRVVRFDIDLGKCMYCGLCVEACPPQCLLMVADYEYSTWDLRDMTITWEEQLRPGPIADLEVKAVAGRGKLAAGPVSDVELEAVVEQVRATDRPVWKLAAEEASEAAGEEAGSREKVPAGVAGGTEPKEE